MFCGPKKWVPTREDSQMHTLEPSGPGVDCASSLVTQMAAWHLSARERRTWEETLSAATERHAHSSSFCLLSSPFLSEGF